MVRRLVCIMAVMVSTWITNVRLVQASCSDSEVLAMASPIMSQSAMAAVWRIEPACDVIESGLLVGTDPVKLTPIGQPIYGYREIYQQEIPVAQDGVYWVAAYARDEEGSITQSPPWPVFVMVPPSLPQTSGGSHGAPPSFTGTDEDFLKPSSRDPHYASLKTLNVTDTDVTVFGTLETGFALRDIGSTDRDVVLAQQSEPLQLGSRTFAVDPAGIQKPLDRLDELFSLFSYPRSGLYVVQCSFPGAAFCNSIGVQGPNASRLRSRQGRGESVLKITGRIFRDESSTQSSATFFIPRTPPGKRVKEAKFRSSFIALARPEDVPSELRLSNKSPLTTSGVQCTPDSLGRAGCRGFAVWDFTEEIRPVAAGGGGDFVLVPNPVPAFEIPFDTPTSSGTSLSGFFQVLVNFNYPWKHAGDQGSLVLTFEDDCPKELDLVLTPETVRPQIPGEPTQQVTVDARVTTCPPQPGTPPDSIVVSLMIDPNEPAPGSNDAGGHFHNGNRPRGNFTVPKTGPTTEMCTVRTFDAQGVGTCEEPKTYFPPEVSGKVKIVAEAKTPDFDKRAEKRIEVAVAGLAEMGAGSGTVVLVGAPNNHAGTNDPCRSTAPASLHFGNHFGQPKLILAVEGIADRMFRETGIQLRVNDMSLQFGGLFDVKNNWSFKPGHSEHRVGLNADIGFTGVRAGACPSYNRSRLLEAILENARRGPVIHDDHFHVRVR